MAIAPSATGLVDAIRDALPGARILTEAADVEPYRWDETEYMHPGQPLAVVFPRDTSEVSALVRICAERRVPIVPRGAGSGLSGGAIAVEGAVTIVMTQMDKILTIDEDDLL